MRRAKRAALAAFAAALVAAPAARADERVIAAPLSSGYVNPDVTIEHGEKLTFLKMNVDENPVTPSSYRVTGIPTINVYQGGEVVKSIVGAKPKAALLKELDGII